VILKLFCKTVSTWLFVLMTHRVEMSVLMLQLSLCVLTVIQMTSSAIWPDVIQQPYDASDEQITPAYMGAYTVDSKLESEFADVKSDTSTSEFASDTTTASTTVGHTDTEGELKKTSTGFYYRSGTHH